MSSAANLGSDSAPPLNCVTSLATFPQWSNESGGFRTIGVHPKDDRQCGSNTRQNALTKEWEHSCANRHGCGRWLWKDVSDSDDDLVYRDSPKVCKWPITPRISCYPRRCCGKFQYNWNRVCLGEFVGMLVFSYCDDSLHLFWLLSSPFGCASRHVIVTIKPSRPFCSWVTTM